MHYLFLLLMSVYAYADRSPTHRQGKSQRPEPIVRYGKLDDKGSSAAVGQLNVRSAGDKKDQEELCSATVYPKKPCVILSAAHCFGKTESRKYKGGTFTLGATEAHLKNFEILELQNPKRVGDLAIAVLDRNLPLPDTAYFDLNLDKAITEKELKIVGYGAIEGNEKELDMRHSALMEFAGYKEEDSAGGYYVNEVVSLQPKGSTKILNAGSTACPSDSGGPIFSPDGKTLHAITSAVEAFTVYPMCVAKRDDTDDGLPLKQFKPVDFPPGTLDKLTKELKLSSNSFAFAEMACRWAGLDKKEQALSGKDLARALEKAGIWRLPTIEELHGKLEGLNDKFRIKYVEPTRLVSHVALWTSSKAPNGKRRAVALDPEGELVLSESPDTCELGIATRGMSLRANAKWLREKLDAITCPAPSQF